MKNLSPKIEHRLNHVKGKYPDFFSKDFKAKEEHLYHFAFGGFLVHKTYLEYPNKGVDCFIRSLAKELDVGVRSITDKRALFWSTCDEIFSAWKNGYQEVTKLVLLTRIKNYSIQAEVFKIYQDRTSKDLERIIKEINQHGLLTGQKEILRKEPVWRALDFFPTHVSRLEKDLNNLQKFKLYLKKDELLKIDKQILKIKKLATNWGSNTNV